MSNEGPAKAFITSIGAQPDGASYDGHRPLVEGMGDAGSIMMVFDGARCIGSTIVTNNGTWTFEPAADLRQGSRQLTALAVDQDGNYGLSSEPFSVTVPVVTPVEAAKTPTDIGVQQGDDLGTILSGHANPGDVIRLYDGDTLVGTSRGTGWYFDLSDYPSGHHHFIVEASDAAGNKSIPAVVDVTLALKGHVLIENVIATVVDSSDGAHQVRVEMGGAASDPSPTLHGDVYGGLNPGEVVAIYRGAVRVGIATIDSDHPADRITWTFQDHDVPEGDHNYHARVEDATELSGFFGWSYWVHENAPEAALSISDAAGGVHFSLPPGMHGSVAIGISSHGDGVDPASPPGMYGSGTFNGYMRPIMGSESNGGNVHWVSSDGDDVLRPLDRVPSDAQWLPAPMGSGSDDRLPASVASGNAPDQFDSNAINLGPASPAPQVGLAWIREVPNSDALAIVDNLSGVTPVDLGLGSKIWRQPLPGAAAGDIGVLRPAADHQIIDLSMRTGKTSAAPVHGVEEFDLGGHANTLKLSLTDVVNLGERDLFVDDGRQQVKVNRQAGDAVELSNSHIAGIADATWLQHGTVALEGITYSVYGHIGAQAEVLIQQGVQAVIH